MDISFHLPGTTEPEITVRRTSLGDIKVLVDGIPAKRRHRRTLSYDIHLLDGTVTELRLTGQWTGLKAMANGVEKVLEPPVPRVLVFLTFVPLLLVLVGGLVGAAFGISAAAINLRIARWANAWPFRVAAMLGITLLGAALYFGVAVAIAPIPTLTTGTCLNGVREGAEVTARSGRPVDCAIAHENEVVGSIRYSADGAYPGQDALFAFAEIPCYDAFAAYVGVDFQASVLEMILITPSDLTWLRGDREIACVALAPNAGKLNGSVRGSAR